MPLAIFTDYLAIEENDALCHAASYVLSQNIINGDALAMRTSDGKPITFAEWSYLGRGRYRRRDFRLDVLTRMSALGAKDTLFSHLGKHEIITPTKIHPPLTISELASAVLHQGRKAAA